MPEEPNARLAYRLAARAGKAFVTFVRFHWRPFWLRRRLDWVCWGAGASATVGSHLSLGRGVRVLLLPGGSLSLGRRVRLHDGVTLVIHPGAHLRIGNGTYVGPGAELHARTRVEVGDDCLLAGQVVLIDHNHRFDLVQPVREKEVDCRAVTVGGGCWLALRAVLTAGAQVGECCVIGAGAVVTGAIPAGAVAAGVPATVVRMRDASDAPPSNP